MGKLKIPISSFSNIVIIDKVTVDNYTFIPEGKGLIETIAQDNNEKDMKLEEVKKFCALVTLLISEERKGIFFILPEEALFFTPSYGLDYKGEPVPIEIAVGSTETSLDSTHITEYFLLFKNFLSEKGDLLRAVQWYHLGNISLDEINSIISYVIAIEILANLIKPTNFYPDVLLEEEIKIIQQAVESLKEIRKQTKERVIDRIQKMLTEKSLKIKMKLVKGRFTREEIEKLIKKAEDLGLDKNLEKLFSQIQSDRGKILHQKGGEIGKLRQKKEWLELFTRMALLKEITNYAHATRKNN
jgi:hypothetical protein